MFSVLLISREMCSKKLFKASSGNFSYISPANSVLQEEFAETCLGERRLTLERTGEDGDLPSGSHGPVGKTPVNLHGTALGGVTRPLWKPESTRVASQRAQSVSKVESELWCPLRGGPGKQCMSAAKTLDSKCRDAVWAQHTSSQGPRSV